MKPLPKPLRITELRRYPVKSLGGESVNRLRLSGGSVVGDRVLAIVTADTGKVLTARRMPQLLDASARWLSCFAEITLPGGDKVRSSDPAASAVLSDWLGRPVRLAHPSGSSLAVEPYESDNAESRLSTFDLPDWGLVDEAPVHLLSEGSLRAARQWHPEGDWSTPRFRPNIVVAADDDEYDDRDEQDHADGTEQVENELIGHQVGLGEALIDVTGQCKRCVMVTQPQRGLEKDREMLRTLINRNAMAFGVYAGITQPGWVSVGDTLTALPLERPALIADRA